MTHTQREAPFPKTAPRRLIEEAQDWSQMPLAALRQKLRAERRRGLAGHWTYDLTRHRLMIEVYRSRTHPADAGHCVVRAVG